MKLLGLLAHAADCACAAIDVTDAAQRREDLIVAKALAISEVAQMARIETLARRALVAKWEARANQAARSAGAVYRGGGSLASAYAAADKVMKAWASDVSPAYARSLSDVYKLARSAGHKKAIGKYSGSLQYAISEDVEKAKGNPANVKLSLDAQDKRTLDKLSQQELWWIGDTYKGVGPTIRDAVQPKVLAGLSRKAGGEMVQAAVESRLRDFKIPEGFHGTAKSYFEGLAANAVTTARVYGQLNSFANLGVTTYTLVNPMDGRTSELCAELNGMEFKVADAEAQMAQLADAKTPEAYKSIKPWLSTEKLISLASKGADSLTKAGQLFPPFHFRCRTTVDIATESLTFRIPDEEFEAKGSSENKNPLQEAVDDVGVYNAMYLRNGMRDMTAVRSAYAGATKEQVEEIAAGERAPMGSATGKPLPPIRINIEPDGRGGKNVILNDGRHRMTAAREAGATQILAHVTEYGPRGGKKSEWTGKVKI